MGDIVRFKRPRNGTIRGAAREILTEAMNANPKPHAVLVIVLAENGQFAMRTASHTDDIHDFDLYARVEAVVCRRKMQLLD